ncbi:MAG TPA: hypothetical protein VK816_07080 [Jatrophihabitantaceae bacterium]|nr:hypothetical protein [Jatrophihabitantaceae bacterium]
MISVQGGTDPDAAGVADVGLPVGDVLEVDEHATISSATSNPVRAALTLALIERVPLTSTNPSTPASSLADQPAQRVVPGG